MLCEYYCGDIPAAIESGIQRHFNKPPSAYQWMYSAIYIPSILTPGIVGHILDKVGVRICALFFVVLLSIGQGLLIIGCHLRIFALAIVGRFIFGIGSINISVAESVIISKWFIGKELALAGSIDTSISRMGNWISIVTQRKICSLKDNIMPGLYISILPIGICMIACGTLCVLDKHYDKLDVVHGYRQPTN